MGVDYDREQHIVDEYFNKRSKFWYETYQQDGATDIVNQLRQNLALKYVDKLSLPKTARILEIGCGAGCLTVALARRGFTVVAVDHSSSMIELAKRNAKENCVETKVQTVFGDIHKLTFNDQSFDLIIALGVIGWLHDLKKALIEIERILKPCGYIIVNSTHANGILNPFSVPLIESFFRFRERWAIRNAQQKTATPHFYSAHEINSRLSEVNLQVVAYKVFGFGPFKFLNRKVFSGQVEKKIQKNFQKYADSGLPIMRSAGTQYTVLARKANLKVYS